MRFRTACCAVIALVALAGCSSHRSPSAGGPGSSSSQQPSDPGTDTASPSDTGGTDPASDTDPATDTSSPSFVTTPPPSTPRPTVPVPPLAACSAPSLTATGKSAGGGLGHAGYLVIFTYHGQIPCQLVGYPGLAILSSTGKQLIQASRTPSGYLGGIRNGKPPFPTVVLNAGESASALLEGLLVDSAGKGCPVEHAVLTTPPNTTISIKVGLVTAICSQVQVHPIVAGTTGTKP